MCYFQQHEMKNFIDNFIDQNNKVIDFLNNIGKDYENADKNITKFKDFLSETKFNPALAVDLTSCLQLLNNEKNLNDFELEDISRLFDSLRELEEYNLDNYVESAHFEWTVMNNKQKTLEITKAGIRIASVKLNELKDVLKEIEED
jgi:hypothetical protein